MIIRSQNKKTICIFGEGCAIQMLGENDQGFLIGMSSGAQDDYDLGYYGTERDAMAVVSNIYYAAKAGTEFYEMPDVLEEPEEEPEPGDITLKKLQEWGELSNRTANALVRAGYTTLEELVGVDTEKLRKIRNIGSHSICELHRTIQRYQEGKI